jgi:hypothetical protein
MSKFIFFRKFQNFIFKFPNFLLNTSNSVAKKLRFILQFFLCFRPKYSFLAQSTFHGLFIFFLVKPSSAGFRPIRPLPARQSDDPASLTRQVGPFGQAHLSWLVWPPPPSGPSRRSTTGPCSPLVPLHFISPICENAYLESCQYQLPQPTLPSSPPGS